MTVQAAASDAGNNLRVIGFVAPESPGSDSVTTSSLSFLHPPRPLAMLRKVVPSALRRRSRGFHSSSVARRIVATNPVKAQEVAVRQIRCSTE